MMGRFVFTKKRRFSRLDSLCPNVFPNSIFIVVVVSHVQIAMVFFGDCADPVRPQSFRLLLTSEGRHRPQRRGKYHTFRRSDPPDHHNRGSWRALRIVNVIWILNGHPRLILYFWVAFPQFMRMHVQMHLLGVSARNRSLRIFTLMGNVIEFVMFWWPFSLVLSSNKLVNDQTWKLIDQTAGWFPFKEGLLEIQNALELEIAMQQLNGQKRSKSTRSKLGLGVISSQTTPALIFSAWFSFISSEIWVWQWSTFSLSVFAESQIVRWLIESFP